MCRRNSSLLVPQIHAPQPAAPAEQMRAISEGGHVLDFDGVLVVKEKRKGRAASVQASRTASWADRQCRARSAQAGSTGAGSFTDGRAETPVSANCNGVLPVAVVRRIRAGGEKKPWGAWSSIAVSGQTCKRRVNVWFVDRADRVDVLLGIAPWRGRLRDRAT